MREPAETKAARALWTGRIAAPPDPEFFAFQRSLPFDARLLPYDLRLNAAWARALERAGRLAAADRARLVEALEAIGRDHAPPEVAQGEAEDVHTWVEAELARRTGDAGRGIHRGKSRNDQVATDLRLWTADAADALAAEAASLALALAAQAAALLDAGVVVPGYTHLQQAEPVLAAHWALAHAEAFGRDRRRFGQVRAAALRACPLGSAALSGTPLPLDREALARDLGFAAPAANSIDAVSDRDFALGFLHAATTAGIHASRLAEDLILWSSVEFAFVRLPDAFTTGSSAMPQKRNADACELARGKAGRLLGRYAGLAATLKGLPGGYNKDLQEDKEALFDACDTARGVLRALAGTVRGLEFDAARARAALSGWTLAAELAERLAATGLPFRDAYAIVARAVQALEARGASSFDGLDAAAWAALDPALGPAVVDGLSVDAALARRAAPGGTAPARVREAIAALEARLVSEAEER